MEREITLRDYGRVLWSGRWIILASTVVAALVGLILTFATSTEYTGTSEVYLGQATSVSGTPVSTPSTNPATAPTALTGDTLVIRVARELGISPSRVRTAVELTAPRAPGGAVGNQPTIATIKFTEETRDLARRGANSYAEAVLDQSRESSAAVVQTYEQAVARSSAQVVRLQAELEAYRRQLGQNPGGDQALTLQSLLSSAGQQLQIASTDLADQQLNLVKERQYGQPAIVSLSQTPSSSSSLPNRARTVLLAAVIGLIVGVIVVFVWRGSPAGRAAPE
ncbi:MAG TPA: Wzz/FepE/Etk N-terminal domain-containing protein [Miltoncostaeaceae bacterium]|nr:Wzz/FepE/Etk N-terminal domain-containing protein [Miltoncostaeaceae bacterium]